ncbi:plasminostreptin [Streptomyces sp. uw30]|uniref:subtilase-type protease inhibitor n=1 Tax=Streptomyces sp. uw30 TaxID=1828179 RepID=UPI0011CD639F|nr:plasminostreptin [Streptomyces sp. uw30]
MRPMTRWATSGALLTAAVAVTIPSALVFTTGHGEQAVTTTPERAVTLNCAYTTSGTHPDPRQACAELDRVNGDLGRLATLRGNDAGRPCTKEYRPVVVTIQGVWRGMRVNYEHTFANSCIKETQGASVFAF